VAGGTSSASSELEAVGVVTPGAPVDVLVPVAAREGARRSILDSAGRVMSRTGRATFTLAEVMDDLRAHGSNYADQTIRTLIGAHMNAGASGTGVAGYADVVRVSRGEYRLR